MDTARIREGIRKMRFSTILDRWDSGEMTQETAAELLGMSVRSFQRWRERYEADGEAGLVDRRGGPSPRRAPQEELERMLGLYRDKYADFTVKHFHEQMQKRHDYKLGYTVTKLHLHRAGQVRPAPKRSAHRKKRPRRPMRGMMLHQDGSRHAWIEGLPSMDLIPGSSPIGANTAQTCTGRLVFGAGARAGVGAWPRCGFAGRGGSARA